ncbi:unnamed protein product [Pylaiella littoralis]
MEDQVQDGTSGVEESKGEPLAEEPLGEGPGAERQQLWVWPRGALTHNESRGPRVGEGELATTHFVIWHRKFNGNVPLRKWTITSIDTDQYIHVLLAMACGRIPITGPDKMEVTVRRRKAKGACDFLFVNRLYEVIAAHKDWDKGLEDGATAPAWFTREAKVVIFVVVYALSGCDFLPSIYNMPFKKMLELTMASICEPGLFAQPFVKKDESGKWTLARDEGVKLIAVCYFMLHRNVFQSTEKTAAAVFERCQRDSSKFVQVVRQTVWRAHGAKGRKNCPAPDALEYQVRRCGAVITYWQAAFDREMVVPEFRGEGWRTVSGEAGEQLGDDNVVIQLSEYALLGKGGKVKLMTCSCNPDKDPACTHCKCGKAKRACVPGYCKCKLKCMGLPEVQTAGGGEAEAPGDDAFNEGDSDNSNSDSDDGTDLEPEGTLDEMAEDV